MLDAVSGCQSTAERFLRSSECFYCIAITKACFTVTHLFKSQELTIKLSTDNASEICFDFACQFTVDIAWIKPD